MSKKENALFTGTSESSTVDDFMQNLNHPMIDDIQYLRAMILNFDKTIGEGIFWNGPTFFYTGNMPAFEPKEYKRYLLGINFYKQDAIRLIFLQGAFVNDPNKIMEGDFKDGRRIITIKSKEEIDKLRDYLELIIKELIELMNK